MKLNNSDIFSCFSPLLPHLVCTVRSSLNIYRTQCRTSDPRSRVCVFVRHFAFTCPSAPFGGENSFSVRCKIREFDWHTLLDSAKIKTNRIHECCGNCEAVSCAERGHYFKEAVAGNDNHDHMYIARYRKIRLESGLVNVRIIVRRIA